ncbi:MAG TPA: ROK family protein [Candidatus Sulfomarinibacteraceae bacterium]|nr:ROK family protein [Candidatus Sulfomarinibacteraceae bacterium]
MFVSREEVGQRSETVRRANLSAIVRELHLRGPLSRSELVARTGLTRSAIRALIGELVAGEIVAEEPAVRLGTPGRPSPVVRLIGENATVLALEIAVDSLAVAVVGAGGVVFEHRRVDRPRGHSSVDEIVDDLLVLARAALARRPADELPIRIGVAVAGLVHRSDGVVAFAPNLGWTDAPLGARLAHASGLSVPVEVGNESDLGALAELRRGAARGADDVLYVHGEVGVGGGIIVDGRPLGGIAGYGGEIGHMPVNPTGRSCRCGSTGCWETEVGEGALLARAGYPLDGGRAAVDALIADASAGRPEALAALVEVGRWLGIGLAGLVNILNPRRVVLGGLFSRIHPFVGDLVEAGLDRAALAAPRRLVSVVPSTLGVDAPLLGAAEMAFEPLLADPAAWLGPREALVQLVSA